MKSPARRRPRRIQRLRRPEQLPKLLRAAGPTLPDRLASAVERLGPAALPVLWEIIETAELVEASAEGGGVLDTEDAAAWAAAPPAVRAAVHATALVARLRPDDGAGRLLDRLVLLGGSTALSLPLRDALTPYAGDHAEAFFDALAATDDFDLQMLLTSALAGAGVKDARLRDILRNELLPRSIPAFLDSVRYTGDPALLPDVLGLLRDAEAHPEAVDPELWRAFMGAIIATGGKAPDSVAQHMLQAALAQLPSD